MAEDRNVIAQIVVVAEAEVTKAADAAPEQEDQP